MGGLGGFLIGAGYGGILALLAGLKLAAALDELGRFVATATLFGAGSAAGSLAIARLADDRQLLGTGSGTADVGLSPDDRRKLLGDPGATSD